MEHLDGSRAPALRAIVCVKVFTAAMVSKLAG